MNIEPLRGKERIWYEYGEHTDHESIETKCFNKTDVKSAVEFYKRYRYNHNKFLIDNPSIKIPTNVLDHHPTRSFSLHWMYWLFDYTFGDVI